jgi:hypothetical protein
MLTAEVGAKAEVTIWRMQVGDIEDMHQKGYKAQGDCTWKGA